MSAPPHRRPAWDRYIEGFHHARPGITEALLSRTADGAGRDPYAWTVAGIASTTVVDVACGSGPVHPWVEGWIGIDRSRRELAAARARRRGPLIAASASRLPLASVSTDAGVAAMALMVVDDPPAVLDELARVLTPGAQLRVLLPADAPLSAGDRLRYAPLLAVLGRRSLPFPRPEVLRDPVALLREAGFDVVSDDRQRFVLPVTDATAGELFVDSLYLPGVRPWRVRLARRVARRWVGSSVGLPLRRIVARAGRARPR